MKPRSVNFAVLNPFLRNDVLFGMAFISLQEGKQVGFTDAIALGFLASKGTRKQSAFDVVPSRRCSDVAKLADMFESQHLRQSRYFVDFIFDLEHLFSFLKCDFSFLKCDFFFPKGQFSSFENVLPQGVFSFLFLS